MVGSTDVLTGSMGLTKLFVDAACLGLWSQLQKNNHRRVCGVPPPVSPAGDSRREPGRKASGLQFLGDSEAV